MVCQLLKVPRDKFIEKVNELTLQKNYSWLAICLFLPPEWIEEASLSLLQVDKLILGGQEALEQMPLLGILTRVGRTSYFAIIENSIEQFRKWLDKTFAKWHQVEPEEHALWRVAFVELPQIPNNWLEILRELEWRAYETSRQQMDNYLFQMDMENDGKCSLRKVALS